MTHENFPEAFYRLRQRSFHGRIWAYGRRLLCPAKGKATYELWDNDLHLHNGRTNGVVPVEVNVISVTASDHNGNTVTYPQYDKSTTVNAPKP